MSYKNELLYGDSFELLDSLPPNSYDFCLTDPPYGISRKNNLDTMGRRSIEFGDWDIDFDHLGWVSKVARVLKPGSSFVIWLDWKNISKYCSELERLNFDVKRCLTWIKTNPMPRNRNRSFLQSIECAIWAVKNGAKWTFNCRKYMSYETGVFHYPTQQSKHPNKKPTPLFRDLIEVLTNTGDTVLDPFSGSATTAISCKYLNRSFTCIEADETFYKLSSNIFSNYSKLNELQDIAAQRGGFCLSKKYTASHDKYRWECKDGHRWLATASSVRGSSWCKRCASSLDEFKKAAGIDAMHKLAFDKGGNFLSNEYFGTKVKYKWECSVGHQWEALPHPTSWCPQCNGSLGEEICRAYFEQIFKNSFPRKKPKWLTNSRNNLMELDGYCPELKMAFEHQGEQHYTNTSYYKTNLKQRKLDDERKENLCIDNNIKLFIIPELFTRTKLVDLKSLIRTQAEIFGYDTKFIDDITHISLKSAYKNNYFDEIHKIAKRRGGRCISKIFLGSISKLEFECEQGHLWIAEPRKIKYGNWCPYCAIVSAGSSQRGDLEKIKKMAADKKGQCLSIKYNNNHTKLKWQCSESHVWLAIPSSVAAGSWCPTCAKKSLGSYLRKNIANMKEFASENNGECLSDVYKNNSTKLSWKCNKGHEWEATYAALKKRSSWCLLCSG